ncbi:MAG: FlgD immunoglobulin-like domain containing protein [bacterium]|nr:FlgD immunoglobulin-like domain containing protein [bacterium]
MYSVAQYGDIREQSWDGSSWVDSVVDAVTGASASLTVGIGRNDDTSRIYATSVRDSGVYEFTNTDPYVGTELASRTISVNYTLDQNLPNPFRDKTIISYLVTKLCEVVIEVYDLSGRLVKELVHGVLKPGQYRVSWDGRDSDDKNIPSGIYFCKLRVENFFIVSKKLILIR